MKIAVPTEKGQVAVHFGRCPEFTIAEIDGGKIGNIVKVQNPGHEPGKIPVFLKGMDVSVILTGGMGRRAIQLFDEMGIAYVVGITGEVNQVLSAYSDGTLAGGASLCQPQHLHEGNGEDCGQHGEH